jgi:N-hydroxyarylamine O-acetyltransferase
MVRIPGQTTHWLADVGFGDSFIEPLKIEFDSEQPQGLHAYRLDKVEGGVDLCSRDFDGNWYRQYFFDLKPRNFPSDYEAACHYHQTSPNSSFTRKRIVSRATPTGHVTLETNFLAITKNDQRKVQRVKNEDEYKELLETKFGISVDSHTSKRKSFKQV